MFFSFLLKQNFSPSNEVIHHPRQPLFRCKTLSVSLTSSLLSGKLNGLESLPVRLLLAFVILSQERSFLLAEGTLNMANPFRDNTQTFISFFSFSPGNLYIDETFRIDVVHFLTESMNKGNSTRKGVRPYLNIIRFQDSSVDQSLRVFLGFDGPDTFNLFPRLLLITSPQLLVSPLRLFLFLLPQSSARRETSS